MTYQLTGQERWAIKNYAGTFVDSIKFMVYENAVIMYVETRKGELDYPLCLGLFDDPEAVMAAALNSEGYQRHLANNKRLQEAIDNDPEWKANEEYLKQNMHLGTRVKSNPEYVKSQCEMSIAYFKETGGRNRMWEGPIDDR